MATIDHVSLDIQVVLGCTDMPVHQVLRLGRGAIIELDAHGLGHHRFTCYEFHLEAWSDSHFLNRFGRVITLGPRETSHQQEQPDPDGAHQGDHREGCRRELITLSIGVTRCGVRPRR